MAVEKPKPAADAIQERCIARMSELGLNANQVAELVEGKVSRMHVYDYLGRKKSMGSGKLQYLLAALGIELNSAKKISSPKR